MRVLVVTAPASAITLDEAKLHLRVRQGGEDTLIQSYINAAIQHLDGLDGWLGRSLGPQVLELQCSLPSEAVSLPLPPLISLVSIKYLDADGVEQTADPEDFYLYGSEGNILAPIATSPPWSGGSRREDALRVRYNAGYAEDPEVDPLVAAVPDPIKTAILMMVADMYNNRETFVFGSAAPVPMSPTVEDRLFPFRLWG